MLSVVPLLNRLIYKDFTSRERGVLNQGSLCSPLKSGGFFGTFECTWWGLKVVKVW